MAFAIGNAITLPLIMVLEFLKSVIQWEQLINPFSYDSLGISNVIPDSSWLRHFKSILVRLNIIFIIVFRA
jgi:hypothetical protein